MGNGFYTFSPPAGWEDISASTETVPQFTQMKQGLRDKGATVVDIVAYQAPSSGDNLMILYSAMGSEDHPSEAELDGFDRGARGSYAAQATESAFKVDKTTSMHVSTQRVHTDTFRMTAVRYVGFQDGAMTTVTANCTGQDDATCDKLLSTLKVDGSKFTPL